MINYFQENECKLDIQRSSSFLFSEDFQFNFEKPDTLFKNDEYVNEYQIDYFHKSQQMISKDAIHDTNFDSLQKISTFQQSVYCYVKNQQTDEQIFQNLEQTNSVSNNKRDFQKEILASYENSEQRKKSSAETKNLLNQYFNKIFDFLILSPQLSKQEIELLFKKYSLNKNKKGKKNVQKWKRLINLSQVKDLILISPGIQKSLFLYFTKIFPLKLASSKRSINKKIALKYLNKLVIGILQPQEFTNFK